MRPQETATSAKARKRERKMVLLKSREVFQTALSLVDGLLEQSYQDIDLDETFYEPAELEMELNAGRSLNETSMPVVDPTEPQLKPRPARKCNKPIVDPKPQPQPRPARKRKSKRLPVVEPAKWLSKPTPKPAPKKNPKPIATSTPIKRAIPEKEEGHICKWPRCWLHEPFRATAKEVKHLSDEEKALWNYDSQPLTPAGFWDLSMSRYC